MTSDPVIQNVRINYRYQVNMFGVSITYTGQGMPCPYISKTEYSVIRNRSDWLKCSDDNGLILIDRIGGVVLSFLQKSGGRRRDRACPVLLFRGWRLS